MESRREMMRLAIGCTDGVWTTAFSPDGCHIAVGGEKTASIWDVATGKVVGTLPNHTTMVRSVVWSTDGWRLATAAGIARVWDVGSGRLLCTLNHGGDVSSMAISPNGRQIATGGSDDKVHVWDIATGQHLLTPAAPKPWGQYHGVHDLRFSRDGRWLFGSCSSEDTIRIWDSVTGAPLLIMGDGETSVDLAPDQNWLAVGGYGMSLRNIVSGERKELTGHIAPVSGVAFSPDGSRLASVSHDYTARVWDLDSGVTELHFAGHHGRLRGVAWSPDSRLLATASDDNTVRLWDASIAGLAANATLVPYVMSHSPRAPRIRLLRTFAASRLPVAQAAFSRNGQQLATASNDGTARIWNTVTGINQHTLIGHSDGVASVAFAPDGQRIATASYDGTARIWSTVTAAAQLMLPRQDDLVFAVDYSPDGTRIVTTSGQNARIWNAATAEPQLTVDGSERAILDVRFSPDGRWLVTSSMDTTARIHDSSRGILLGSLTGHSAAVLRAVFSPDGGYVATASEDKTARIWSTSSKTVVHTLAGHGEIVSSVAYSPNGRLVATASADGTVRMWDATLGTAEVTLAGMGAEVMSAAWSSDGTRLVTTDRAGVVRIWEVIGG